MLKKLSLLAAVLLAAGCASKGNLPAPAKLAELKSSLNVSRDWVLVNLIERDRQRRRTSIYAGESLFLWVDNRGRLHAQDSKTGERQWVTSFEAEISSTPNVSGDSVLVVTQDGDVLSLDKQTGAEQWRRRVSSTALAAPQVSEGIVVVYCIDGKVFGLSAADGGERWRYDSQVPVISLQGNATPALANDRVLVGLSEGDVAALDLWTGKERWRVSLAKARGRSELDRMVDVDTSPVVLDDMVYTAAYQGQVVALQLRSGRVAWTHEMSTAKDIAVSGEHVYVVDEESVLYALNRETGRVQWKQSALQWRYLTAPVLYKDFIIVGDMEGYLHWLDGRSGEVVHRLRSDYFSIDVKPVVANDKIYAMSRAGIIDVLKLNTSEAK
jgi:outer membrane protein assembly factor BamB